MSILNNKKKRTVLLIILISVLTVHLFGCAAHTYTPTKTVLATVLSAFPELPAVRICYSDATESDEYFLDDELLLSLFGTENEVPEYNFVEECALFVAKGQTVAEFAIFRSYTFATTKKIAQMCQRRLDTIKKNAPDTDGKIITAGKYVVLTILPDNNKAKSIVGKMLD